MRWLLKVVMVIGLLGGLCSKASAETYEEQWCLTNTLYAHLKDCYPSSDAFIAAYWALISPGLNSIQSEGTHWGQNRATLDNCETRWPGPPPVIYCTITHYYTSHTYGTHDEVVEFTPWTGYFGFTMMCGAASGMTYIPATSTCAYIRYQEKPLCACPGQLTSPGIGNPVTPLDGVKRQSEQVFQWGRGHNLTASYNYLRESLGDRMNRATQSALGPIWFTNHHKSSLRSSTPSNEGLTLHQRANGSWKTFYTTRGYIFDTTEIDGQPKSNANGTSLWYYDMGAEAIETHAWGAFPRGYATAVAYIDGRTLTYTRASLPMGSGVVSVLQSITDDSGRQVGFTYENDPLEAGSMRIVSATDPAGNVYGFRYGAKGQLTTFQYPDQTTRQYQYEVDGKPWLMTALIDETGSAYGRYSYDSQGRAVTTRTGTSGVQWSIDWTQAPQMNVTETFTSGQLFRSLSFTQPSVAQLHGPDGYEETLSSTQVNGVTLVASRVQPAGAGSASATVQYDRDSEGNITRQLDANGLQSCHAFVANRHAESTRVDGLAGGTTCGTVLASNATLPTGARKVSSLWHPVWRKQVRTAEPNRITTLVYNGQPDPTNGNAVASCAPSTALLPDGSAIVVLCKRVEQATTDANGALGFNAVAQPGVAARTWSWTYDAQGHVLTETDPLDRTTTNTYYADSTADHWTGDLKSSTNAAGHVTNYLRYSALGQVLEVVDANGLSTVYTYDVRSRLTSVVQADQTTSYTYWPTGLVKQVTQPDGSTVSYDYDDAHRLVAVADNLGNRIQYTLDQRGNRTNETVQDPNGTLQRSLGRVFDALSRTQKTMGGE